MWRVLDVPHDWSIEDLSAESGRIGPFSPAESPGKHFTGNAVGGTGWYRKHFRVDGTGKRVSVLFDGVYMDAELWINGRRLGEHPHGYTSFEFDLTPWLNPPGEDNVLAVRVRNEGRNSRWYSGSGIYRPVWLTISDPVRVPTWGVFVTTPIVTKSEALAKVSVEVENTTKIPVQALVQARIRDAQGNEIGGGEGRLHLAGGVTEKSEMTIRVPAPELWSPDSPNLYAADVTVLVEGKPVDLVSTDFGIRKLEFDAKRGFLLNGESLELRGGCIHHDNGPLGSVAIRRAEERKVELLKTNGFNAVRCAHNPPSTAFLQACDRVGMLVIDEAFDQWNESKEKNAQDYHRFFKEWHERDIAAMVRRDRNHPSVIMWSVGNEIPEQFRAGDTGKQLRDAVLLHDTTRPVTQAICTDWGKVIKNWDQLSDPAFTHLDVAGYNYLPEKYESDHARHPDRVMYGSESYPMDSFQYWSAVEKNPYVIGDFVWTAMDYLGEAGIGHSVLSSEKNPFFMPWPWYNAWCGDIDLIGQKKPQSFYRDVVWRRSDIEMLVHEPLPPGATEVLSRWAWPRQLKSWNWPGEEGKPLQVSIYSRCEKVRLILNGKVIGEKAVSAETKLTATFEVPYAPGELHAQGLREGKVVAKTSLKTTGPARALKLIVDRGDIDASRDDLAFVTVEVVDDKGQCVPNAKFPVRFAVSGVGELAAQGSGVPNMPASFREPVRETFQGRCLAILRPRGEPGTIRLQAAADGLQPAEAIVNVR